MLRQFNQPVVPECNLFLPRPSTCRPGEVILDSRECDSLERTERQNARFIELLETSRLEGSLVQHIKALLCSDIRESLKELELQLLRAILDSTLQSYHVKITSAWLACEKSFLDANEERRD